MTDFVQGFKDLSYEDQLAAIGGRHKDYLFVEKNFDSISLGERIVGYITILRCLKAPDDTFIAVSWSDQYGGPTEIDDVYYVSLVETIKTVYKKQIILGGEDQDTLPF